MSCRAEQPLIVVNFYYIYNCTGALVIIFSFCRGSIVFGAFINYG